jgi:hypothetical protein
MQIENAHGVHVGNFFLYVLNLLTYIIILDIIHHPVFYLKLNVSETGFCILLQVEPAQMGPTDRASLCLRSGVALSIEPI